MAYSLVQIVAWLALQTLLIIAGKTGVIVSVSAFQTCLLCNDTKFSKSSVVTVCTFITNI